MFCLYVQSFSAGLAAAGALTSAIRLVTKAAFEKYDNGLRKGTSMPIFCINYRPIGEWFIFNSLYIFIYME
jgi:hypothetical protein